MQIEMAEAVGGFPTLSEADRPVFEAMVGMWVSPEGPVYVSDRARFNQEFRTRHPHLQIEDIENTPSFRAISALSTMLDRQAEEHEQKQREQKERERYLTGLRNEIKLLKTNPLNKDYIRELCLNAKNTEEVKAAFDSVINRLANKKMMERNALETYWREALVQKSLGGFEDIVCEMLDRPHQKIINEAMFNLMSFHIEPNGNLVFDPEPFQEHRKRLDGLFDERPLRESLGRYFRATPKEEKFGYYPWPRELVHKYRGKDGAYSPIPKKVAILDILLSIPKQSIDPSSLIPGEASKAFIAEGLRQKVELYIPTFALYPRLTKWALGHQDSEVARNAVKRLKDAVGFGLKQGYFKELQPANPDGVIRATYDEAVQAAHDHKVSVFVTYDGRLAMCAESLRLRARTPSDYVTVFRNAKAASR